MSATSSEVFVFGQPRSWEAAGTGVHRKILGHDDQIMMMEVVFEQGAVGALHSHPHRQVTYIKSGSFDVEIGGERKVLKAGDCYFIPPNVPHGVVALEPSSLVDVFTPRRDDIIAGSAQGYGGKRS